MGEPHASPTPSSPYAAAIKRTLAARFKVRKRTALPPAHPMDVALGVGYAPIEKALAQVTKGRNIKARLYRAPKKRGGANQYYLVRLIGPAEAKKDDLYRTLNPLRRRLERSDFFISNIGSARGGKTLELEIWKD